MKKHHYVIRSLTVAALLLLVLLPCLNSTTYAMSRQEEIEAKIDYLEKKRNLIQDTLTDFKSLKKQYDENEAKTDKTQDAHIDARDKRIALEKQLKTIKKERQETRNSYGTPRRILDKVIPTSWNDFKKGMSSIKLMAQIKYYRSKEEGFAQKLDAGIDRSEVLAKQIKNLKSKVLAISPDPKKFMADSKSELDDLYKKRKDSLSDNEREFLGLMNNASGEDRSAGSDRSYDLSDVGVASDQKGMTDNASGSLFDFWSRNQEDIPSSQAPDRNGGDDPDDDTPRFVDLNQPKDKAPKTSPIPPTPAPDEGPNRSENDKQPKFLNNIDKKPPANEPDDKPTPTPSPKDDYRIVSISAETVAVQHGKQTLRKLKSIGAAVIVIEMRGQQYIIDGNEAVAILIEKGMFYNFPGIGIVATTKYDRFGGRGKDTPDKDQDNAEEDDACGRKLSSCYAQWGADLKSKKDYNKMSTDEYWARVKCVQLEKRCKMPKGRIDNFTDGFKRTPMSDHDARIFGGGVLGPK